MRISRVALYIFLFVAPVVCLAQQKDVVIRVVQDEIVATAGTEKSSIALEKSSFKVQVLLQNISGVYVFASLNDSLYNLPDNVPVPGFSDLPAMVMAEEQYNKEKELIINNEGWAYWFYDPEMDWHRFNKKITLLDSGRVVGSKSIKQLHFIPGGQSLKLKENNRPLYLFFVAAGETDNNGNPLKELLRRRIKIEWRDEE